MSTDRSNSARVMRALLAALMVFPAAKLGAQAATADSLAQRPKALRTVVISATRTEQEIRTLPSHVLVISRPEIAAASAQTVPDLLRRIPGFTTRDFQSGLVSGPSQSIVSFRGLGGSSAGRALVLLDGLPAGDPFSGWLDWGRIPLTMLESAEVIRGGGSMIWGSRSLAGVVNLRTIAPRNDELRLVVEGGSMNTYRTAGSASVRRGSFGATLGAERLQTDGFIILRQAGSADTPERTEDRSLSTRMTWDASETLHLWLGGSTFATGERPIGIEEKRYFDEARGGLRWVTPRGVLSLSSFSNRRSSLTQTYSYNTDRSVRSLGRSTASPAHSNALSLQWTQGAFGGHELTAGADFSLAAGSVIENSTLVNDVPTRGREGTGTQEIAGIFLQDAATLGGGVRLVGTLRADRVDNHDGRRIVHDYENDIVLSDSAITGRTTDHLTYSLGLRWQQREWIGWRASVYKGFRAASMYEMYFARFSNRGGAVTEANANLRPERLRGAEVGVDLTLASGVIARFTTFTNRVADPIMDVTIGTAGTQPQVIAPCGLMPARQTCAQRQNLPGLQSRGVETEVSWQPNVTWDFNAGYAFSPTRVLAPGHPADGMWAIRSSRHLVTGGLTYSPRWATLGVDAKFVGRRFDDDQNTVELPGFALVGLRVNRPLGHGITAYMKVENLLNRDFDVARTRTGSQDRGAPRWVTAGLRATM